MDKLNIYQKLIEVRKSVPYLKKENSGYQFKYVSSSQTLGALREAMDTQGLMLIPKVTNKEIRDHSTRKGDHEYFTAIDIEFTWVNAEAPSETIVCPWYGQGLDDGEKGVGKALTYAEKFFLLKFFNIATDKDDPDSIQKPNKPTLKEATPPKVDELTIDAMRDEMARWVASKGLDGMEQFKSLTGGRWENPLDIKEDKNVKIAYKKYKEVA